MFSKIKPIDSCIFLAWTVLIAALAYVSGYAQAPQYPPPIRYIVEVRDRAPTIKECKQVFKNQLKGVSVEPRN